MARRRPQDELSKQLQYLRKGEGLTLAKLRSCAEILRVSGAGRDPQIAYDRLVAELDKVHNSRSGKALRNAYALGMKKPGLLGERRHAYANQRRRTDDTIENWENDGIDDLRLRLLDQLEVEAAERREDAVVPGRGEYKLNHLEISYRYVDRCFTESLQTREIVALTERVDGFVYRTHNTTKLTEVKGGKPVVLDHDPDSGWTRHKIMFPKPLSFGDSHEFVVREEVADWDGIAPAQDKISQIFHHPTHRFWAQAKFSGDIPPLIWYFEQLTHFERPGLPTAENTLKPAKTVSREFYDCYGGFFYGLAWKWKVD